MSVIRVVICPDSGDRLIDQFGIGEELVEVLSGSGTAVAPTATGVAEVGHSTFPDSSSITCATSST